MNILAWSITFTWDIDLENLTFNTIINGVKWSVQSIFMYGDTDIQTSKEVIEFMRLRITDWEIISVDVSISTEDKIKLFKNKKITWNPVFWTSKFVWMTFENLVGKTPDNKSIISIREAEKENTKFWARVIKMDYLTN